MVVGGGGSFFLVLWLQVFVDKGIGTVGTSILKVGAMWTLHLPLAFGI